MNAYKCDICGKYFEDGRHKTGSKYRVYFEDTGHHSLRLLLKAKKDEVWELFIGDMCPDCMGYFCVGLFERGCREEKVKMYAADYIKKFAAITERLGAENEEETTEDGTTE